METGLMEARGERRGRLYHLSAAMYRGMGKPAAYVRAHGLETAQMEQLILQYAQAHERITRREAADLCQVQEHQASYLLRRLRGRGKLELVGTGRGAHYRMPQGWAENV